MKVATDFMFTQMSEKEGMNKFGEKAVSVMVKEYRHIERGPMEGKPVVTPIDPVMLSYKDKRKSLDLIHLTKKE